MVPSPGSSLNEKEKEKEEEKKKNRLKVRKTSFLENPNICIARSWRAE